MFIFSIFSLPESQNSLSSQTESVIIEINRVQQTNLNCVAYSSNINYIYNNYSISKGIFSKNWTFCRAFRLIKSMCVALFKIANESV